MMRAAAGALARPARCVRLAAPGGSPLGCWAGAAAPAPAVPARASACQRKRVAPRVTVSWPRAACASVTGACGAGCTACPPVPRLPVSKSEKPLPARNIIIISHTHKGHVLPHKGS